MVIEGVKSIIPAASLFGLAQAVLTAVIFWKKSLKNPGAFFFGAAMFSFGVSLLYGLFYRNDLVVTFPHLMWIGFPFQLLQGPFLFLFIDRRLKGKKTFSFYESLHLIPFIMCELWMIPFYFSSSDNKIDIFYQLPANGLYSDNVMSIIGPFILLQVVVYIVAVLIRLKQYARKVTDFFSQSYRHSLNWIKRFCLYYSLLWFLLLVLNITQISIGGIPAFDWLPLIVALAIFYLGVSSLSGEHLKLPDDFYRIRYENTPVVPGEQVIIEERLEKALNVDKAFLDSDLSLSILASRIGCSPHQLSRVVNSRMEMNFNEYINSYRIKHAKELIKEEPETCPLLEIAMESGFGTKASFNLSFKKSTGMTPGAYRKSIKSS